MGLKVEVLLERIAVALEEGNALNAELVGFIRVRDTLAMGICATHALDTGMQYLMSSTEPLKSEKYRDGTTEERVAEHEKKCREELEKLSHDYLSLVGSIKDTIQELTE